LQIKSPAKDNKMKRKNGKKRMGKKEWEKKNGKKGMGKKRMNGKKEKNGKKKEKNTDGAVKRLHYSYVHHMTGEARKLPSPCPY